jgi:hypothetical protein
LLGDLSAWFAPGMERRSPTRAGLIEKAAFPLTMEKLTRMLFSSPIEAE